MEINSIFVFVALATFHQKKSLRDTMSFALETISYRFSMCYQCLAQYKRKSNSTSTNIVLLRHSSFTRTLSLSSSRSDVRSSKLHTPSSTVCGTEAILTSRFYEFDQRVVINIKENALAECVDTRIVWEAEIVAKRQTNRAMNRLSARQQRKYDKATQCYICRQEFVEGEARGHKVRNHDHITGWFISAPHRQCNLERPGCFKIPVFFHNLR